MDYRRSRDLLSDLPLSIIHNILSLIPFRDAVRTSILSRNWRYTWTSLPHLVIDENCFSLDDNKSSSEYEKYMENSITQALFHHKGHIHKFELSVPFYKRSDPKNDEWVLCLSRKDIRELTLSNGGWFSSHSNIYSCKKLTHLELHFCNLDPPPLTFKGFSFLRCLVFNQVFMSPNKIECLVANCPLLERLELSLDRETKLRFSASNLKYLYLDGDFLEIRVWAPLLADVSVELVCDNKFTALHQERKSSVCNYTDFFGSLTNLEKLHGRFYFTKHLSMNIEFCQRSLVFHHLKVIELDFVDFEDTKQMLVVARLINGAPNLHELKIKIGWYTDSEDISLSDFKTLEKLRVVKMTGVRGRSRHKEFIKFLLQSSPVLETMSVGLVARGFGTDDEIQNLNDELLGCNRASPSAKICIS